MGRVHGRKTDTVLSKRLIMVTITEPVKLIEWESTISVPINKEIYDKFKTDESFKRDVIILYENGTRLSQRRIEEKRQMKMESIVGIMDGTILPIERTQSVEVLCVLPDCQISKIIDRIVIKDGYIDNSSAKDVGQLLKGVRLTLNKEECEAGVRYMAKYELEYEPNSAYDDIFKYEEILMESVVRGSLQITISRDILTLKDMFACIMCKVQMWHCFNDKLPYSWAYKWNGIKGKMMILDKVLQPNQRAVYLWPDVEDIKISLCSIVCVKKTCKNNDGQNCDDFLINKIFATLYNLCLLVEILDDRIIILELIGASFRKKIHAIEPRTNLVFLKMLHGLFERNNIRMTVGEKPVFVQQFFKEPIPKSGYNADIQDGLIIIQNDLIIKWKIPTVDIKCIADFKYSVGDGNVLTIASFKGEIGKIYELSPDNKILRCRSDRLASSGEKEYKCFLESVKLL